MTPTTDALQPNLYELRGAATEISYQTTSQTGQPGLLYTGPGGGAQQSFTGQEIRTAETELGTEVTVKLSQIADGDTRTLTVLIPPVRLLEKRQAAVETVAIITTKKSTIAGAPEGADYAYEVVELTGVGLFVEF